MSGKRWNGERIIRFGDPSARPAESGAPVLRFSPGTEGPEGERPDVRDLGGPPTTVEGWKNVLQRLRDAGITPYSDKLLATDDQVAGWLLEVVERETGVAPDPRVGINNPGFYEYLAPDGDGDRSATQYGFWHEVVASLKEAGVGLVRHVNKPDLPWYHVMELRKSVGEEIPPPAELRATMTRDAFSKFADFTYLFLCCWAGGLQLVPLLFEAGGGSTPNDMDEFTGSDGGTYYYDSEEGPAIKKGKPPHQHEPTISTIRGWADFYHQLDGSLRRGESEEVFQRFALNVYNPETENEYMQECARRKSLALAAYGQAVGEYLAALNGALAPAHVRTSTWLQKVIPHLETGNEMDTYWMRRDEGSGEPTEAELEAGARELGRFHAILAGSVKYVLDAAGVSMSYRLGDILGWREAGTWPDFVNWLRDAVKTGVVEEVSRWSTMSAEWTTTMDEAGFYWPPQDGSGAFITLGYTASDLVSGAGFHFYNHTDEYRDRSGTVEDKTYADETQLFYDVNEWMTGFVYPVGNVAWSISLGFPAMYPRSTNDSEYYEGTNEHYQAGLLARRLLFALCLPSRPETVKWYTLMSVVTKVTDPWGKYKSMGVRNDVFDEDAPYLWQQASDYETFTSEWNAWRRAAWFTLQRVGWLLALARTQALRLISSSDLIVLRLESEGAFYDPDTKSGERYDVAYVLWIDQKSSTSSDTWTPPETVEAFGWCLLHLVPDVDMSAWAEGEEGAYPTGEAATWGAVPGPSDPVSWSGGKLTIRVDRAHPDTNPAPLCVLLRKKTYLIAGQEGDPPVGERLDEPMDPPWDSKGSQGD